MATVNVYEQYFEAEITVNEVERHAALVMLIATSEQGMVSYEAAVTFFPHNSEDDYAVSYDAFYSKVLFEGKGRRSKKRDAAFLETIKEEIDSLAAGAGGEVYWDRPLREARYE